jgi:hypothetical protein
MLGRRPGLSAGRLRTVTMVVTARSVVARTRGVGIRLAPGGGAVDG